MSDLKISIENNFLKISLNRPGKHNSLSEDLMLELINELKTRAENLSDLKALVLTGEGKSFCAGADLNWMKSMVSFSLEENKKDSEKLFDLFYAFYSFPLPVITYAHGNVYGGGLGFLGASDYVIAERGTNFCFSEVKLGLIPAVISSFINSKCSHGFSNALMTSGEVFTSGKAFHMGLVQKIDKEGDEPEKTLKSYAQASQEALIAAKKLSRSQALIDPRDFKEQTIEAISNLRVSPSAQQRMNDFLDKRGK